MLILARGIFSLLSIILLSNIRCLYAQSTGTAADEINQDTCITGNLNTEGSIDFSPSTSADGKRMVFISNRNGSWQLFSSERVDNHTWTNPLLIDAIRVTGDEDVRIDGASLSIDGNSIYFSMPGNRGSGDIYLLKRTGETWKGPEPLDFKINTSQNEGYPAMDPYEKTLYFTRERDLPDQVDKNFKNICYAIFYSEKGADGLWTEPRKLPYPVNYLCDKSPRIMPDNRTLIFSSYRPDGKGNYDLFKSQINQFGEWSTPTPLTMVNTEADDQLLAVSTWGDTLYFSNHGDIKMLSLSEGLISSDIFLIHGRTLDEDTKLGCGAQITVSDASNLNPIFEVNSNPDDGKYMLALSGDRSYNINIHKEGYSASFLYFDFREDKTGKEIFRDINLFSSVKLKVNIRDTEIYTPVSAKLSVYQDSIKQVFLEISNTQSQGYSILELPVDHVYRIMINGEGYKTETFDFDISEPVYYRNFEKNINLSPEKINVPINVNDINTNARIPARIILTNYLKVEKIEINANEMIGLRNGSCYRIEATTDKGYFFFVSSFEVEKEGLRTTDDRRFIDVNGRELNIKLMPIRNDASIELNETGFENNSAFISDGSYDQLASVISLLNSNPTMKVEIAVSTDNYGNEDYNRALSSLRALSIVHYLELNNIQKNRLSGRGYGNRRAHKSPGKEESRKSSNIIELKVLEVFY